VLISIHNLSYYQRLLARAREAILADRFVAFQRERLCGWSSSRRDLLKGDQNLAEGGRR
jgi:tRNA-guanine family transglycosylase